MQFDSTPSRDHALNKSTLTKKIARFLAAHTTSAAGQVCSGPRMQDAIVDRLLAAMPCSTACHVACCQCGKQYMEIGTPDLAVTTHCAHQRYIQGYHIGASEGNLLSAAFLQCRWVTFLLPVFSSALTLSMLAHG